MQKVLVIIFFFLLSVTPIYAHPGRTDSSGCHTCHTNCENWGLSYEEYHCHSGGYVPYGPVSQPQPIQEDSSIGDILNQITPRSDPVVLPPVQPKQSIPTLAPLPTYEPYQKPTIDPSLETERESLRKWREEYIKKRNQVKEKSIEQKDVSPMINLREQEAKKVVTITPTQIITPTSTPVILPTLKLEEKPSKENPIIHFFKSIILFLWGGEINIK